MSVAETIGYVFMGIGLVIFIALLITIPTWLLWNWLMPDLFGIKDISLLQAFGLLLLTGFLFRSSSSKSNE